MPVFAALADRVRPALRLLCAIIGTNVVDSEFPGKLDPLAHLTALQYLQVTPINLTVPCFLPFSRPVTDPEWLEFIRSYVAAPKSVDFRRLRCLLYPNLEVRICQEDAKTEGHVRSVILMFFAYMVLSVLNRTTKSTRTMWRRRSTLIFCRKKFTSSCSWCGSTANDSTRPMHSYCPKISHWVRRCLRPSRCLTAKKNDSKHCGSGLRRKASKLLKKNKLLFTITSVNHSTGSSSFLCRTCRIQGVLQARQWPFSFRSADLICNAILGLLSLWRKIGNHFLQQSPVKL